eukprot:GHVP01051749.1.p1 GENE.GHVP01051749.1~~GHVP01051749.1.p1  ORF type:complete len:245 (-),score=53.16 GHVP01051749.1:291-1025(-)
MPSIENQVASRGSQLSFLGDLVPEAVQETFRRMTLDRTDETKSAKDIKTEIATISLYRILGMYDNFHNHHYFSGEVLLKLRKAIDVAVDFAEGIPYGEASSPYVAEWHSIRSHIADFGNSLTPIDFNTVRETVAMLVFFVEAHQKLLSEEREWQEKNKGENNHSFDAEEIQAMLQEVYVIISSLSQTIKKDYGKALTVVCSHLFVEKKKKIVHNCVKLGVLCHEDGEILEEALEETHMLLDAVK